MLHYGFDWQKSYASGKELTVDLNIPFDGPGIYLTETDTIVVVAETPDGHNSIDEVWHHAQPYGTRWRAFVWNCPFHQTYLAAGCPPTRYDTRKLFA